MSGKGLISERVLHWWLGISLIVMIISIMIGLSLTEGTTERDIVGGIICLSALSAGCSAMAYSDDGSDK
jgi:hypothetical protein